MPHLEKEAKERQSVAGGDQKSAATKQKLLRARLPQAIQGRARDKATELTQAGSRYVSDAKQIQNGAPELAEERSKVLIVGGMKPLVTSTLNRFN